MSKPWWLDLLETIFGGQAADAAMRQQAGRAGLHPPAGAAFPVVSVPLGSGYDRKAEEWRQRAAVVSYLRSQLGDPYVYGKEIMPGHESEADGGDCSEYVEAAYRVAGLVIPDGCVNQRPYCRRVKAPKAGDLIFLNPNKNGIPHVLTCTGEGTVVHALGGKGVVEQPLSIWELHQRFAGFYRHPSFMCPMEERA